MSADFTDDDFPVTGEIPALPQQFTHSAAVPAFPPFTREWYAAMEQLLFDRARHEAASRKSRYLRPHNVPAMGETHKTERTPK
jgi:hypothetical protein